VQGNAPPPLTTTEHAALGAVAMLGEASGYDVAAYVRRSVGLIWSPARSHIYRVLPRLEALGLTVVRNVPQAGKPTRSVHSATAGGHAALAAWLADVDESDGEASETVCLLKLFFGRLSTPATMRAQVDALGRLTAGRLERYHAIEPTLGDERHLYQALTLSYGIARAEASLVWAQAAAARLTRAESTS
jgi:DNA-binding PadR family transcriptional regulator